MIEKFGRGRKCQTRPWWYSQLTSFNFFLRKVEKRQLWVAPCEWFKLNFASCVVHQIFTQIIVYMASPLLLVDHGVLRQLCKKRLAVLPPPTLPSPPQPPPPPLLLLLCCCYCCWAAAELLLCCCCCHIRVALRVPRNILCASRGQPIFPFFDTRFVFLWSDGISAIRSSQTQSKWCQNESGLFQVRSNYLLIFFYRTLFCETFTHLPCCALTGISKRFISSC